MKALHVRAAEAADRAAWDAFVASRPDGDPLQLWGWGEVVAPTGERPVRLLLLGEDGRVRGLAQALVRRVGLGLSLLYVPHGPLWEREAADAGLCLAALLEGLRETSRQERGIAVKVDPRGLPGAVDPTPQLEGLGLRRARFDLQASSTRLMALLDGGPALWATWQPDARRLARRAEREGVTVEVRRDADRAAVADIAALLAATAARGAFAARSQDFLQRAADVLVAGGGWYLALARLANRPIAGMAVPRVGRRAYYLYGGTLRLPELRHAYGAYAAMAALCRALAGDGVETLDLWGVVDRDDPTANPSWRGFSAFKRAFGGEPLRHPGTFDLVTDPLWYRVRDLRERLTQRP